MSTTDGEGFEPVRLLNHEDYLAVLERLRPRAATIEFVLHPQEGEQALADRLADWVIETRQGVPPRPGYAKPDPKATLLVVRAHREVFAVLRSYEGFFRLLPGTPGRGTGDRVEFTEFGNVDVVFLDQAGRIIFWTVTHEGLAFE